MTTGELLDRAPPADIEAEAAVIGSVLLVPQVLDDVLLIVDQADFWDPDYRAIYGHLCEMHAADRRIDTKLLAAHAKKAGAKLNAAKVAEAYASVPTAAHAAHYAGLIREQAIRRELKLAGGEIVKAACEEPDGNAALDASERLVLEIRDRRGSHASQAASLMEILTNTMADISARSSDKPPWLSTGFSDLDGLMGFRKGELTILAARPSMGKTALALNIASHVALSGEPVLFFSLEMSALSVGERLLSSRGEVDGMRMKGALTQQERRHLVEASAELSGIPLTIDDSPTLTMQSIAAVCRRQKRRNGLSLVVLDYLQLVTADNARDPREQQVAKISKRLKGLARELDVPVMCLAQLNRQSETAKDNKPRLAHLRESGSIEQDADVVAFVHRPEYFITDAKEKALYKGKAEIHVEKNRNGRTGVANLLWFPEIVTFRQPAPAGYESAFDSFNQDAEY